MRKGSVLIMMMESLLVVSVRWSMRLSMRLIGMTVMLLVRLIWI